MYEGYNIIEQNGSPAKKRFTDAKVARTIFQQLRTEDLPEAARRAKIRKMYDGHSPFRHEDLVKSGLKHIANVNWGGLKAVINNRADLIMKLATDTANLVELKPMARELAGPDAERIARVISEEFSATLREEGKFIPAIAKMNKESDLYGLGPITWANSLDYTPIALERSQIQFRGDGSIHSSEHDFIMFESILPAYYIFQLLDHEEMAVDEGWNIETLKKWAVRVFKHGDETSSQPGVIPGSSVIESQLSLYRRNLFEEEHQFDTFKVIHVFVREMKYPRGVTHLILPAEGDDNKFIYEKENAYTKLEECFMWYPASALETYARAVRGIASDLFPIEATMNKLKCSFVDMLHRNMSIFLTQAPGTAQSQISLNEQGPYTFIPKELQPIPANIHTDPTQTINAMGFLDMVGVNSVTGQDKHQISQTGPKLHAGSNQQSKQEQEVQQRLRSHYDESLYVQRIVIIDKVIRQSFRRFIKLVQASIAEDPAVMGDYPEVAEFLQRCTMRGLTPEQIVTAPQMFSITSCRDLVLGAEGKVNELGAILNAFGGMIDESGRKSAVRDIIQLRLGVSSADRYAPEISRDQAPSDQSSFATLENNMMKSGQAVMVGQDQHHWSHIPIHAQVLQEIVRYVGASEDNEGPAASQAGAGASSANPNANGMNVEDPRGTLNILLLCSNHIQEHLAIGGQQIGMDNATQQVQAMIKDLRPTIKALNLAVATQERVEQAEREKQQRELEALQQAANENELRKAQYEADKKAEVDRYRVDRDHEVAMHKLELERTRGDNADALAEARAVRADNLAEAKAVGDEQRRNRENESRIEAQRRLADAKINAANSLQRFNNVNEATGMEITTPEDIVNMNTTDGEINLNDITL